MQVKVDYVTRAIVFFVPGYPFIVAAIAVHKDEKQS